MVFVVLGIIIVLAIIANTFAGATTKGMASGTNERYTDEELDGYGLDEDEKELVRRGDYGPWNFEETDKEDMEEDDYHYEDDM